MSETKRKPGRPKGSKSGQRKCVKMVPHFANEDPRWSDPAFRAECTERQKAAERNLLGFSELPDGTRFVAVRPEKAQAA